MRLAAVAALVGALALASCGGDDDGDGDARGNPLERRIADAARVTKADFPATRGRSLQQIADGLAPGLNVGLATSIHVPGENRLAFGLFDSENASVFARSAVYLAPTPGDTARGPFPAPLDSMVPARRFLSRTVASDRASPKAIYETRVRFDSPGRYAVLVVAKVRGRLLGGTAEVSVQADSLIPDVGERPPAIDTPTVASVGGDIQQIETRVPPDSMHDVGFRDVLGRRPVALLFATPALCESRTCGPVTDLAEQLKATYGRRMAFIHNEVYRDNDPAKGLRPQLEAFNLQTEPWLFTVDRAGRVAARLEGAFGIDEFRRAIEAALH
jgi:hypothetical protein